ncbi:hypothetical protein IW261DRAFT_1428837 [Armillaria novae-zelandiae]|uniref:DRBM domain-containing protein n=1 Tax=Armillaria novae-zelandiae TaxID=153914 RepID=A0AA39N838_9AGAR|nr:hypothetical protein IW261DRAFT_1428837 [Armillaria novae-zelandiae]
MDQEIYDLSAVILGVEWSKHGKLPLMLCGNADVMKHRLFRLQHVFSNNCHNLYLNMMKNISRLLGKKSIETAIVPLEILKAASGAIPIPALALVTEILLSILNLAYQTQQNADTHNEIVTRCVRAHATIAQCLENMGITADVSRNIEQFERLLTLSLLSTNLTIFRNLKDVWDFVERENHKNGVALLFYSKSKKDNLQHLGTQFEDTLQLFQINTLLSLQEALGCLTTWLQHMEHNVVGCTQAITSFLTTEVGCDSAVIPVHFHIYSGQNYSLHTAEMQGRCVIMKVFKGCNDGLNWQKSNAFDRTLLNPHIPRLIAISGVDNPVKFSMYDFNVAVSTESFILSSVRQGLKEMFKCGITLVYGISASNDYEVHIFWDTNERAIVSMDSDLLNKPRAPSPFTEDSGSRCLAVLDNILFKPSEDHLDHRGSEDNSTYLQAFQTKANEMQNTSHQPPMSSVLQSMPSTVKPQRELVWKASYGHASSIQEVAQQYQSWIDINSQWSLCHQYRNLSMPQTYHRCKGYSREEVTLTHAAFDSKIVVHATPSLHEVCLQTMMFHQIFSVQNASHGNMSTVQQSYKTVKFIMSAWIVNSEMINIYHSRCFTGPQHNGVWISIANECMLMHSDCQVNGVKYGQGTAKSVRAARQQASYQILLVFGRL